MMDRNGQILRKPLHVMHVLGNLGPGGAEMGVVRLIRAFPGNDVTHSICIFGNDLSLRSELGDETPCHAMGFDGRVRTAFWPLADLLREQGVDIVHVNNLAPWFDAALGAALAGCRCILTFHGVEQAQLRFSFKKRVLFRLAARLTDRMTAVAAPAADLMAALTGIGRERIHVIDNGIDTEVFRPLASQDEKKRRRVALGLPESGLLLGCVAALRSVKNHRGLINAFAQAFASSDSEVRLVLVGDGALEEELRQLCRDLGEDLAERVLFLGRRADVAQLLPAFDAFVLNSDTEGLSYAVLEAMACGLPIVATAVGANPHLVESGVQGYLVPSGDEDALATCFSGMPKDNAFLQDLGMNARHKVEEEFSLQQMALDYRTLYLRVRNKTRDLAAFSSVGNGGDSCR